MMFNTSTVVENAADFDETVSKPVMSVAELAASSG